ncbi:MAG: metallophosphoesterase family protein [Deltaproteobacteria bacterium]|nr:metallophosphoesterase family protein [Deltaproteobacteria bacterium]
MPANSFALKGILASCALLAAACGMNEQGNISSVRQVLISDPVPKDGALSELRAACGDGGITETGAQEMLRLPYLQQVTADSSRVLWTTASIDATTIVVTEPDGTLVGEFPTVIDEDSERPEFDQYNTELTGLEPGQIYCYQIVGESDRWMERTGFRTAPATGDQSAQVRIAVIGDLGTQSSDQYLILEQLGEVRYDLVLVAGDLAYENGTLSDHENNFFSVYEQLSRSIPFFVISGNHDYASDGAIFREVFSLPENGGPNGVERWYSFDWGPVHITALDTEKMDQTQADWLERDLAASEQPWKLAFLHRPPFSSGWHGSNHKAQDLFTPSFVDHGVQLVLAGHDHNYERTHPIDGVTYAVIGSSGRGTRDVGSSNFTAYSEAVSHFGHITIGADDLALNAIDASGQDFDHAKVAR